MSQAKRTKKSRGWEKGPFLSGRKSGRINCILIIAGSDSGGGAGIQADIKTVTSLGGHPLTAVTALTAQSSLGISAIHKVPTWFISKQIDTVVEDVQPSGVKIGMLYSRATVEEVAASIKRNGLTNVVLDPVAVSSTGQRLLEEEAIPVFRDLLLPLARVVTPNVYEAGLLTGLEVMREEEIEQAAKLINQMGPHVVITGGHRKDKCSDLLCEGGSFHSFSDEMIDSSNTHGSGCVFSTAMATFLGEGKEVRPATRLAHDYARKAIKRGYVYGKGGGCVRAG